MHSYAYEPKTNIVFLPNSRDYRHAVIGITQTQPLSCNDEGTSKGLQSPGFSNFHLKRGETAPLTA